MRARTTTAQTATRSARRRARRRWLRRSVASMPPVVDAARIILPPRPEVEDRRRLRGRSLGVTRRTMLQTTNPRMIPMRRALALIAVALMAGGLPLASHASNDDPCTARLLVLSAFPGEMDPLISKAAVSQTVVAGGKTFYLGTLEEHPVIMALTGIGLVNARATATLAFQQFRCGAATVID